MLIMRWGAEAHWDFFQYSNLLIKHYSQLQPKFYWVLISARNSAVYFSHIMTTSNNSTRLSLLLFHKWGKWYLTKSSNLPKVTKLTSYRTPLSLTCTPYCLALRGKDVTCLLFYETRPLCHALCKFHDHRVLKSFTWENNPYSQTCPAHQSGQWF